VSLIHRLLAFFAPPNVLSPDERAKVDRAWDEVFARLEAKRRNDPGLSE
jgi:hypothetical protein